MSNPAKIKADCAKLRCLLFNCFLSGFAVYRIYVGDIAYSYIRRRVYFMHNILHFCNLKAVYDKIYHGFVSV